ncbi:uncharacterized protein LAJ45_07134 [Morchella importuna]|uniref:Phosphatidate cytidylyltransferase n=1 Tax=Morchella conica CCBAS932 TaxID=1392247 RepID=A0A3N4KNK9_9PEZI|nr:uncharacterized protein LAJ45_07134 [Morchella importuna]KAH8148791.1 hypothetical protein LAJ45_07134 [Morchella importuna]RPB10912.1 hypothetical protein P167DRAFT_490266 [Morchella conica CCBAS932]
MSSSLQSSPASSSTSLNNVAKLDSHSTSDGGYNSDTSATSSDSISRARSRSPLQKRKAPPAPLETVPSNGYLSPPTPASVWRNFSRSPSPLGLIPIHRKFSSLIHRHEVPRKLLHVSIGFIVLHMYRTGYQPTTITPPLITALIPIASADLLRFYSPEFNNLYIRCLGALMRESEVAGWNGVVWYLVGTITVLTVFPKDIAVLSILLLSWCDTAASTVGRAWGRYTPRIRRGKSLAGSLASFVVGAVTAAVFFGVVVPGTQRWGDDPVNAVTWAGKLGVEGMQLEGGWALGLMSLVTGLIASASEAVDAFGLDDNVTIPVLSAVGVWGVMKLFG